jgi:hypothetical protein
MERLRAIQDANEFILNREESIQCWEGQTLGGPSGSRSDAREPHP